MHLLLIVAPLTSVGVGWLLRSESREVYWGASLALTVIGGITYHASIPHGTEAALIGACALIGVPMMAASALQRVARSAPTWIAMGLGLATYGPIILIALTLTMQIGELFPRKP